MLCGGAARHRRRWSSLHIPGTGSNTSPVRTFVHGRKKSCRRSPQFRGGNLRIDLIDLPGAGAGGSRAGGRGHWHGHGHWRPCRISAASACLSLPQSTDPVSQTSRPRPATTATRWTASCSRRSCHLRSCVAWRALRATSAAPPVLPLAPLRAMPRRLGSLWATGLFEAWARLSG